MTKVTKQKSKTTTKKAAPKKKAPAITVPSTTIRMIEEAHPCFNDYFDFLKDFGGEPLDTSDRYHGWQPKRGTKTSVGPDTPIPLTEILRRNVHGHMSGRERIRWIVEHGCVRPESFAKTLERLDETTHEALVLNILLTLDAATIEKLLD